MHGLDLSLETLDPLEVPVSDFAAGVIVGVAFGLGVVVGAVLVLT